MHKLTLLGTAVLLCLDGVFLGHPSSQRASEPTPNLNLGVSGLRKSYPPYSAFCKRHPGHCDMTGPAIVPYDDKVRTALAEVNTAVNRSITCETTDFARHGVDDFWDYPDSGEGDCEDIALEKRARLVKLGLPRAAMTLAIVQHKRQLYDHALLLIETTAGTWVLDNRSDEVVLWYKAPYNYAMRERLDGSWERYDQTQWTYD